MKVFANIKHWFKQLVHGATWTNWLPGEPPPHPWTQEMMNNMYRKLVDSGAIEYGEPLFLETYKKREGKQ